MGKVLLNIEDRYLKGLLLRILAETDLGVLEANDEEDVNLKLSLFGATVDIYVMEVQQHNREHLYSVAEKISQGKTAFHGTMLALIPDDSMVMVAGALKAGINDVLLLPKKKEHYRNLLTERIMTLVKKGNGVLDASEMDKQAAKEREETDDAVEVRSALLRELKLASRGNYTISLLMVQMLGLTEDEEDLLQKKLVDTLRDTDRVLPYADDMFVVVCPFTTKPFLVEVERKLRLVFKEILGVDSKNRRLHMFGANYPTEEKNVQALLQQMEDGIHDSKVFSNLREPLNRLSSQEVEDFRSKLKRYKI